MLCKISKFHVLIENGRNRLKFVSSSYFTYYVNAGKFQSIRTSFGGVTAEKEKKKKKRRKITKRKFLTVYRKIYMFVKLLSKSQVFTFLKVLRNKNGKN